MSERTIELLAQHLYENRRGWLAVTDGHAHWDDPMMAPSRQAWIEEARRVMAFIELAVTNA